MDNTIINRVAKSNLLTFDLDTLYTPGDRILFDMKEHLIENLILKEKKLRDFVKSNDWSIYKNKHVAITCTTEAIIPVWSYMLIAVSLQPFADTIILGTLEELEIRLFQNKLAAIDWNAYKQTKVVVKGCSKTHIPMTAYVDVINRLIPLASSVMYGEPCSTVPLYKKPFQSHS